MSNVIDGMAKAATDRFAADMAIELRVRRLAVVSLYPGLVRTQRVMRNAQYSDLSNSESPQFLGRAMAGLAVDPHIMNKSGQILVTAARA